MTSLRDSITIERCEQVYEILEREGFAASNVSLGVGSFSMQCITEDGEFKPFTRDTFTMAIKATYCEIDGKPYPIFKSPKEGQVKKSQKGACAVYLDENGEYYYKDELTWDNGYQYAEYTGEGCTGCGDCYYTCPEPLAIEVHIPKRSRHKIKEAQE